MKSFIAILLVVLSACFGCTEKIERMPVPNAEGLDSIFSTLRLEENLDLLDDVILDCKLVTDTTFLLISRDKVFLYLNNGIQKRIVGNKGEGPGEYLSPDNVYVSDNYIYIWCRIRNRILVYSIEGDFLKDYLINVSSLSEFVIYKDRLLCCLYANSFTGENKIVEIFDLKTMQSLKKYKTNRQEDFLLSIAHSAGGLSLVDDKLVWCSPSCLSLHVQDLNQLDNSECVYEYNDNFFRVDKLEKTATDIINRDKYFLLNYLNSNSRILQVDSFNGKMYIIAEIGEIVLNDEGIFDFDKRFFRIYVFNMNFEPELTLDMKYPIGCLLLKFINGALHVFRGNLIDEDSFIFMDKYFF